MQILFYFGREATQTLAAQHTPVPICDYSATAFEERADYFREQLSWRALAPKGLFVMFSVNAILATMRTHDYV